MPEALPYALRPFRAPVMEEKLGLSQCRLSGYRQSRCGFAASRIGEERSWRILGEVAALPNDARGAVSSGLPESTSGCVDLTHIGRGLALRQGQPQGFASFL